MIMGFLIKVKFKVGRLRIRNLGKIRRIILGIKGIWIFLI
jgi:hypothetical protein